MKEKLFKKGITRRLFSVVLALAMVLTMMPMGSIKAHAAVSEYKQFIDLLGNNSPATIEGLVEVSGPDADEYTTFKLLKDIIADQGDTTAYSIAAGSSSESPRNIILDLNGHTINRNLTSESGAGYNGYALRMSNYVNLIIDDSTASGTPGEESYVSGTITGGAYSGIYFSADSSTLTLRNGKITGNYGTNSGGGIYSKGTLTIEGGEVCNNISDDTMYGGGGIYTNGIFYMTGGAIYENKATATNGRGGGIFIFGDKTYSIKGGKIFDNECNSSYYGTSGAGIYANKNQVGSEIGGSVQIYDNKNIANPDLSSSFYAYMNPENIKIVPFTTEGRVGYSVNTDRNTLLQIAKEITQADLSHISSEYAASENMHIFYCGGEDVHLNLAGEDLGSISHTHTAGTLWAIYHYHTFSYAKEGDVITAYCTKDACPGRTNVSNKVTLEISAESKEYSATETYAGAKIVDADGTEIKSDNVNKWTSAGLPVPSIKIYKANTEGATSGGTEVSDLTGLEVGNYYASVTCGSETLKKAFKINLHAHNWVYTVGTGDDANKLTATCTPEVGTCPDDKTATLTLTASSANYSGNPATITLEGEDVWENAKIDVPGIKYFKGTEELTEAPTTPGDYTAKISAGNPVVTASVDYTISVAKNEAETVSANNVVSKINEIGTVEYTDACKAKIDAAREAYDALEEHLTSLVTNYDVLTAAEAKYAELKAAAEKLKADTLAANAVDTLIKAIGKVEYTDACKAKIDAARKAYDALTEDQKKLVKELKTLEDAEKAYEALKPTPSPDPTPTPTPAPTPGPDPVPTPEAIVLGTSYDTIQTGETVTSKGKVTGITISANSISMNGILTVNSKLKITILDGKWSVAGYSEDRVTPETLNSVKWLAVDGTKKDAKLLKKYAKSKYYKATKKKGAKTLITAGLNKKDIDGVYAVKLVDDQGHTFVLNIECNKAAKISKKDALKITEAGKSVSANDILAMADGESVKTISLSYVGKDKKVSKSLFNNNAITWKVGTGKKAQTIKCGEVTEYKTKKGDVIGYLTVTEDGSVKVLAGSVKGKLSLSATVNGKAYKTSVSIKK